MFDYRRILLAMNDCRLIDLGDRLVRLPRGEGNSLTYQPE